MHQRSLDSGVLRTWTKSFKTTGVEGEDAVQMLRDAFKRRGENPVEVVAILNDTTGSVCIHSQTYYTLLPQHQPFSISITFQLAVDLRLMSNVLGCVCMCICLPVKFINNRIIRKCCQWLDLTFFSVLACISH